MAEELHEDLDRVFKTLVLRGDKNGLFVCVVPGSMEVDLKVAARISGNKNCAMIHVKELLPLTGYIRGGCSPIGMKKPLPTFIHESALLWDSIYISAGTWKHTLLPPPVGRMASTSFPSNAWEMISSCIGRKAS